MAKLKQFYTFNIEWGLRIKKKERNKITSRRNVGSGNCGENEEKRF